MKHIAYFLCLFCLCPTAFAQSEVLGIGTWIKRDAKEPMKLIVEQVGTAHKLTYRVILPDGNADITVLTQLDGKDAPQIIKGKPSGETMAISRIDSQHYEAILKFNGRVFGNSKGELSADGKVLKVDSDITSEVGGSKIGKQVEYWDRQ